MLDQLALFYFIALFASKKLYTSVVLPTYLTLKHDYEDLQRKYEREIDSGNQMKKTIKRLNEEKDSQSGIVAKFYALCRGFGEEYIESQAMGVLEREAMERQQKKLARKRHDRDAR